MNHLLMEKKNALEHDQTTGYKPTAKEWNFKTSGRLKIWGLHRACSAERWEKDEVLRAGQEEKKIEIDPRLHPQDFFNIHDPTEQFLT